jgi:hypothetical protein
MRHIETLPGPVYLQWEKPTSSLRPKFERVKLRSGHDRRLLRAECQHSTATIDYVTEGTWAANQVSAGIGDLEWAAEKSGIHDYEDMLARQARDRVFKVHRVLMAALDEARGQALQAPVRSAGSRRRRQNPAGADGTPMVTMKDGRQAGPGIGVQTPEMQGGAGGRAGRQRRQHGPAEHRRPQPGRHQQPGRQHARQHRP